MTKAPTIRTDPKNANRGTQRGEGMLERSLQHYGAGRSVLLDKHGVLIAGNKTFSKAQELGIPVQVVESDGHTLIAVQRTDLDLETDQAAMALGIADNRVGQVSLDWSPEALTSLFDAGVEKTEFWFPEELDALFAAAEPEIAPGLTDPDDVPAPPVEPITKPGDLWLLGKHRLLCGDSTVVTHVERLMNGEKADMVFTDPPYGINVSISDGKQHGNALAKRNKFSMLVNDDSTNAAVDCFNLISSFGIPVMIWWGANYYTESLPSSSCWIIWDKQTDGNDFADAELAWTNQTTAVRIFRHRWSGMMKDSERGERRVHPTQKPVALAAWAFERYGKSGDLVLDLFGGSGSTLIACEQTGRRAALMEIDPQYCDVIVKRWENLTGQTATLERRAD